MSPSVNTDGVTRLSVDHLSLQTTTQSKATQDLD